MNLSIELQEKMLEYRKILDFIQSSPAYRKYVPDDVMEAIEKNIARLEKVQFSIAAFGETNSGKSALLNALVGVDNADESTWVFEVSADINHWSDNIEEFNGKEIALGKDINAVFYDTPGIAGDIEQHLDIALKIANKCDILLFVMFEPIKNELQVPVIRKLLQTGKEYLFVINKVDLRRSAEIEAIERDLVTKFNVARDKIVCAAGFPINGSPQIETLIDKIISVIAVAQGDLITRTIESQLNKPYQQIVDEIEKQALQSRQEADLKMNELILKEDEDKKTRLMLNHFIIHGAAATAGTSAFVLAQMPGGDELALTAVTTAMTTALCKNYNKLSRQLILTYLSVISGSLLGKMGASYLYRWMPFLGNIINCAVTVSLHEAQGWLIVSFLEKGLYTKGDIEKNGIEKLQEAAEELKNTAEVVRKSSEFSAERLKELQLQAKKISEESKSFSDSLEAELVQ